MSDIKLKSVKNIRDFGGIVNKEGKRLKDGMFIRSGSLSSLSDADAEVVFDQYHVKTVIDLRTQGETSEKPDRIRDGIRYLRIPIINEAMAGISHEQEAKENMDLIPDLADLYRMVCSSDFAIEAMKKVFDSILRYSSDGAVLWHCTEGKDRCGVISALFLSLLDVDREAVIENYLLTNRLNRRKARKYYALVLVVKRSKYYAKKIHSVFIADRRYIEAAFDEIEQKFGTLDRFFRDALGITDEMKAALKANYLE